MHKTTVQETVTKLINVTPMTIWVLSNEAKLRSTGSLFDVFGLLSTVISSLKFVRTQSS